MTDRLKQPAYALHALVAVLDRGADRILREKLGITFNRYLTLLTLQRLGSATQRELAAALGVTEPSISRSVPTLAGDGYVSVLSMAGEGNRRRVELTAVGQKLVDEAADLLEDAFAQVMKRAGVSTNDVLGVAGPMLTTLGADPGEQESP